MARDWSKFGQDLGTGLQGVGAWLGGRGIQWEEMQRQNRMLEQQEAQQRAQRMQESRLQRTGNMALRLRSVGQELASGNPTRAITLLNEDVILGAQGTPMAAVGQEIKSMIQSGRINEAQRSLGILDQEFTNRLGLPKAEAPEPLTANQIQGNQVVTQQPGGGFQVTELQGYEVPASEQLGRPGQRGITREYVDENGNRYMASDIFDPNTNTTSISYSPVTPGAPAEPQGKLTPVGSAGMTAEQRIEEASLTSAERAAAEQAIKMSGEFITQLNGIEQQLALYDEAERLLLEEGAQTGPILSRLPRLDPAAIMLEQVQSQLGLNIIQNTTFGALSEAEMRLAMQTGLPTELKGPALVEWLRNRKAAQRKLSGYLREAAIFLGTPGNTPAQWMEYQRNRQLITGGSDEPLTPEEEAERQQLRQELGL